MPDWPEGMQLKHYRIIERLGSGGMGIVYRAEDMKLRRGVALKFISNRLTQDRDALEHLKQEARGAKLQTALPFVAGRTRTEWKRVRQGLQEVLNVLSAPRKPAKGSR